MIDWARVEQLREDVGDDGFQRLAVLFLDEVQETIDRLHGSGASGDLQACLHLLRGSALTLGFRGLCELCETGERAAAAGQPGTVDKRAIIAAFEQSRIQFTAGLDVHLTGPTSQCDQVHGPVR